VRLASKEIPGRFGEILRHSRRAGWKLFTIGATLLSINLPATALGTGGSLDRSFGNGNGYVQGYRTYEDKWRISGVLPLPDGRAIIGGEVAGSYSLHRYSLDGAMDPTFGVGGTTIIPEFSAYDDLWDTDRLPELQRGADGAVYLEVDGLVRRLDSSGALDQSFQPAQVITRANFGGDNYLLRSYSLLVTADARIIVVTAQDAPFATPNVSVRFFLSNGARDTVRGDANGERLVNPGWPGRFLPANAVLQSDGRILILARWVREGGRFGLVLMRLNADGSFDASFGQNGTVLIGDDMAKVGSPRVVVSGEGRIAVAYGVTGNLSEQPTSYFMVRFYRNNGMPDTGLPAGGVMGVLIPNEHPSGTETKSRYYGVPVFSGERLIVIRASCSSGSEFSNLLWEFDPVTHTSVPPVRVRTPAEPDGACLQAFGGGNLWGVRPEDYYSSGRGFWGYWGGAAFGVPLAEFEAGPLRWIRSTVTSSLPHSYSGLRVLPDQRIVVSSGSDLHGFDAAGNVDASFGKGGALRLEGTVWSTEVFPWRLVDEDLNGLTYGVSSASCWWDCRPSQSTASVTRLHPDGTTDESFAERGTWTLPTFPGIVKYTFVGSGNAPWALAVGAPEYDESVRGLVTPRRYGVPGFRGEDVRLPETVLASSARRAPDDGLQAVVVAEPDNGSAGVRLLRWSALGSLTLGASGSAIVIESPQPYTYVPSIDSQVEPSGKTVIAFSLAGESNLRPRNMIKLMRLNFDGSKDTSFGQAGTVDIEIMDGLSPGNVRLVRQSDGKIILGYARAVSDRSVVIVVARYLPDGQPDLGFTADGKHERVFSFPGYSIELSAMARAPDGKIVVTGGNVIFRLYGETTPPPATPVPVVEFFNTNLNHYFITGGAGEIAAIEAGAAGPGWSRTGLSFKAYAPETGIAPGALPTCRFYGTPGRGPNSHFYTVDSTECELVKQDPGWTYEGIALYIFPPSDGQCAAGTQPVYRAYNMRFAQNDSNHRYTTDAAVYAQMQAQGWAGEGVKFCGAQ